MISNCTFKKFHSLHWSRLTKNVLKVKFCLKHLRQSESKLPTVYIAHQSHSDTVELLFLRQQNGTPLKTALKLKIQQFYIKRDGHGQARFGLKFHETEREGFFF